jgi:hypothetical protein
MHLLCLNLLLSAHKKVSVKTGVDQGATQIVVVCGAADLPKRKFLSAQNLSIASEWFVGGIV